MAPTEGYVGKSLKSPVRVAVRAVRLFRLRWDRCYVVLPGLMLRYLMFGFTRGPKIGTYDFMLADGSSETNPKFCCILCGGHFVCFPCLLGFWLPIFPLWAVHPATGRAPLKWKRKSLGSEACGCFELCHTAPEIASRFQWTRQVICAIGCFLAWILTDW